MTRRLISVAVLVALPLAVVVTVLQTRIVAQQSAATPRPAPPAPPAPSSSGLQLDALDKSADACTDFYQFACGGWIAQNPVPADRASWGRFEDAWDCLGTR